jgi:adenylate cyclase
MEERAKHLIRVDLSQFKLHIRLKSKTELTLHFDSPSRRFYLSVMALVVTEMKKLGQITSIPLEAHADRLILLNETIGQSAGSSERDNLIPRIYKKWKDALPDLEKAPLFRVVGRKKESDDTTERVYRFSEKEKDIWANLFDYRGSEQHLRLRFSIDKVGAGLDDVAISYDDSFDADAWEKFVSSLRRSQLASEPGTEASTISTRPSVTTQTGASRKTVKLIRGRRVLLIVMLLVMLSVVSFLIWHTHSPARRGDLASVERMAFPLPDKPSIAVLPFANMSDEPKQEYLADGLAEEIINALSKLSNVFVIARNSTFTYKGRPVKIQQVAEEMGVRYVLEGSVRKMGDKVRITAQLVDALTGRHLMSEQYERDVKDIFALQDDVTMKVLTSLRVNLTEGESARTFAQGTKNLEAYLKILQAYELRVIWNKESQMRARHLAEEAIALDPGCALAYSNLALVLSNEAQLGVYDNPQNVLERAYRLAEKAVSLDDSSAWSHLALGLLSSTYKKDLDKSIAEAQRAIALEPGSTYGFGYLGSALIYAGRYEDAIPYYKKALRLSPRPMPIFLMNLASGHTALGQYEEAIRILKGVVEKQPDQTRAHAGLVEAYVLSGKESFARKEAAEILRIDPTFSLEPFYRNQPYKDKAELNRRKEALRKAGLK